MKQNRPNQGFGQMQFDQNVPWKSNHKIIEDFVEKQTKSYIELTENVNKLNTKVELFATQERLLDNQVTEQTASSSCQHGRLPEKPEQNSKEQV